MVELIQLGHLPMVVATGSYPAGVSTQSMEVVAGCPFEQIGHVPHVIEGVEFFDLQPLLLVIPHGLQKGLTVHIPPPVVEGTYLGGIMAIDNMRQVHPPSRRDISVEVIHWVLAVDTSSPFPGSSGGGPGSPLKRGLIPRSSE